MSFLFISSWLCNVAFDITTPPTLTGFNFATGVNAPVLPTLICISNIFAIPCSALNFPAIAHLGDLLLLPNFCCNSYELTLNTTPSIS